MRPLSFVLALLMTLCASVAHAKPWKGAEMITHQTFEYGAFEARIRAARGSGMVTAFFLWKDGSELAGTEWQEQDFEIFGSSGGYQTQIMTPGDPRTQHVENHELATPAWENYFTYRMEWTPDYLAFYIDGQLVRMETDAEEYAKLLDPARAEPAQLRLSLWAADNGWSGEFDASSLPASTYVDYCEVYSHTPGQGPNGSDFTSQWRDDFDWFDTGRWWLANWTFDSAINDYVPDNAAAIDGKAVLTMTSSDQIGQFPGDIPENNPPVFPDPDPDPDPTPDEFSPVLVPARLEAETVSDHYDTTSVNEGDSECGSTSLDVQLTGDVDGECNIGWSDDGEWTEYVIEVETAGSYELVLRAATVRPQNRVSVTIDGDDVSGELSVPSQGWQTYSNVAFPLELTTGEHTVRVHFITGGTNLNYLEFLAISSQPLPDTCDLPVTVYEAESMSASTGGATSEGWNLWSNGTLSTSHDFAGGDSVITVWARGEEALDVWPHMTVYVGQQLIGELDVSDPEYAAYEFYYAASASSEALVVEFDNDYYQDGEDRNLLIDAVGVDECP